MSRSRKTEKGKKSRGSLSQFGFFDIPDVDNFKQDGDDFDIDDDSDLEAELHAILGANAPKPAKPRRRAPGVPGGNLDAIIAKTLQDEPSDEENDGVDDDDPSLLAELSEITGEEPPIPERPSPVLPESVSQPSPQPALAQGQPAGEDLISLLKERLDLYVKAEHAAKENNDSSKARRYKRGIDQLKTLLKRAESGVAINQDDIPVPVAIPKPAQKPAAVPEHQDGPLIDLGDDSSQQSNVSSAPPQLQNKEELVAVLTTRRDEYKIAAVTAKRNNDIDSALGYIKIIKQFEVILNAVENGQPVDLSTMPPPPPTPAVENNVVVQPPERVVPVPPTTTDPPTGDDQETSVEEITVLGALESRLAKYVEQEENAKREGNSSKMRRMGRIVKQYKEAIALHNRGKPIPIDELPTPPGFPPIPVESGGGGKGPTTGAAPITPTAQDTALPVPSTDSVSSLAPSPGEQRRASPTPTGPPQSVSPTPSQASTSSKGGAKTRNEKQLAVLLSRQKEYREAALRAKQANDLVKAKEYLRASKGFDSLIDASRSGLPIDMDTIPRALGKKSNEFDSFEVIRLADCIEGSDSEIYDRLITDLKNQLKMCVETLNHFKAIGDIANANRFENLALNTKKDYNTVRGAHMTNSAVPKFHYEQRSFSIVRCNIDLNDNDLELNVIKGINYNVPNPKEIDTYIKYEFPYPNDEVKTEKTSTVYNTNNPEYNTVFLIPIQRNSRPFQRLFKRHSIKLYIWSKGGFLRSDQLLATVQVKLQPLETKCTIHDAFDLMDGRKPFGGKLEVKIRLRNPIGGKQIEQINEKWLVID